MSASGSRHRRRPRMGQHFLHDQSIIDKIITSFAASDECVTVEIGPGKGALTERLLPQLRRLHAIEKDSAMVEALRAKYDDSVLALHHADAVSFDYQGLLSGPSTCLRFIGNLPYSISTPLLFKLARLGHSVRDMTFMVQREVADRLLAKPGGSNYGRLTVMTARHYMVERICNVAPGAFSPPPRVRSSVVRFSHQPEPLPLADEDTFSEVVRCAFSARRKTLGNALTRYLEPDSIAALGISPELRPGQLSPQQYAQLANIAGTR